MLKKLMLSIATIIGIITSITVNAQLTPIPPNIVSNTPKPMIMLNMSKDHQLFYRAYDEYSDLDGDSIPESTYKHSFNYYGYFDSFKCYNYDGDMFVPVSINTNKYCSGQWSGNFLNWSTMTRVDVLRKVLYGGMRSTDTGSATVLERTNVPTDAHAFAKYYKGDDLDNLTPFTADQLAPSTTSTTPRALYIDATRNQHYNNRAAAGSGAISRALPDLVIAPPAPTSPYVAGSCAAQVDALYPNVDVEGTSTSNPSKPADYNCISFAVSLSTGFAVAVGDQVSVSLTASPTATFVVGVAGSVSTGSITLVVTPGSTRVNNIATDTNESVFSAWTVKNLTQISATICNATLGSGTSTDVNYWSHSNTNPPLMRVARGDYQLWNANERWQCYWSEEKGASNGNNFNITGLGAASSNPTKATRGVQIGAYGPDYTVRVKICDPALLGGERCKKYPDGNYKPIGLLQEYGEKDLAEFGLLTGSFAKNISGGVLRSNMQTFRNEVNYLSNGIFTGAAGIVSNLNKLRVYGYRYNDGTYLGDGNCTYQLTGLTDNQCTSWGNPLGEMFLESLRYLGGKSPTPAFNFTHAASKDEIMGLSKPAWIDPFLRSNSAEKTIIETKYGKAQCRPINVLNFNASVTSYDHDQLGTFSDLPGAPTVASLMNVIGVDEFITGNNWFVGSNGTTNNRLCTAKNVTNLSDVRGICSDGPAYYGSYSLPAMAYWAHTNKIRNDIATTGNTADAFKVKTYSVALSPGKPRIEIPNPVAKEKKVVLQPAYFLDKGSGNTGGGTLVDFRIVEQTPTRGKYLLVWEDSEQGGDYDQDVSGILRYEVVNNQLKITTQIFAAATGNPQGFGYTVSGTNGKDGAHFHSGIFGFNFTDLTNLSVVQSNSGGTTQTHANINSSGGCSGCQNGQAASQATYDFATTGANAGVLQDPMWFAAKWGGFRNVPATGKPDLIDKWDTKKSDGTLGADGVPDTYFLAYRADLLETALRSVFNDIVSASNTAPAVASSQVSEGSLVYQGQFDASDGRGELQAYAVQADGTLTASPVWDAHQKLTASTTRQIITNVTATTTVAFTWDNLTDAQKTATFGGLDAEAQARLDWVRGARTNEAPNGYRFRARNLQNVMGSIVNSNPHVQARPRADFVEATFADYEAFRIAQKSRPPIIWVGAGDGMLHGFNSSNDAMLGGTPVLSYIPGPLLNRVGLWSNPDSNNVLAGMEGSPFSGDLTVGSPAVWKSYVFSSLGRGGRGVFALDATNTAQLTEANASSIFKWQFTDADDADLGYVLGEADAVNGISRQSGQIAKMNNGKFATLFGNGVLSTSGKAALFILYADGPSSGGSWSGKYIKLVADVGSDNGLSQPMWVDTNGDGLADAIYAGDLKGNLWKFDVKSTVDSDWSVAFSGKPLFIAKDTDTGTLTLPISAVTKHRFHPLGGLVVNFATGKAVDSSDFPDTTGRSNGIFGIWDKLEYANMSPAQLDTNLPRTQASLALRTFTRQTNGNGFVVGAAVDWGVKKGWYTKFPVAAEASLSNPSLILGLIAVVSVVPNGTLDDNCYGLPTAYLTLIDPITGLLETDIDGQVDNGSGVLVNVASTKVGGQRVTFVINRAGCPPGYNCLTGIIDAKNPLINKRKNRNDMRIFWREIPTYRTR